MRYLTADAVTGIPTLKAVAPEELQAALNDASKLLGYITDHQWVTDDEARRAFEKHDWTPDQFNRACGVLQDTGRLLVFPDTVAAAPLTIPAPTSPPVVVPATPPAVIPIGATPPAVTPVSTKKT